MSFILGPNDRQQRCEKHYDSWKKQRHRKNKKFAFLPFFSSENLTTHQNTKSQKSKVVMR